MAALLGHAAVPEVLDASPELWGFGGLHGGLALALIGRALEPRVDGQRLTMLAGTLMKPLRGAFGIELEPEHRGRSTSCWRASATAGGTRCVSANALFAVPGPQTQAAVGPRMPDAPPPADCPVFTVPTQFVPIANRTEIRPVGPNRPYAGGREPELSAWLRLVDDDAPPDPLRLVYLMDALAPSYAAVLGAPVPIPTVSLSVCPAPAPSHAASPWVLLRARTQAASADGWVDERLDAWSEDGTYLGSGHQRRVLLLAKAA